MRSTLLVIAASLALTACASQTPAPAAATATPAPAAKVAKMPQCYNGDTGKFADVGSTATLSGVAVVCEKTSDGKNAQWMGKKH